MGRIEIDRQRCKGCQLCIVTCPQRLIVLDKTFNKQGVHPVCFKGAQCSACALCAQICPECCIEVYR